MNRIIILLYCLCAPFVVANNSKPFDYVYSSYTYDNSSNLRMYEIGSRLDLPFKPFKRSTTSLQWSFASWSSMSNDDSVRVISIAPLFRYKMQVYNTVMQPYIDLSIGFSYLSKKDFAEYNLSSAIRMQDSIVLGFTFGKNKEYDLGISYSCYNRVGFSNNDKEINAVPRLVFGYRL